LLQTSSIYSYQDVVFLQNFKSTLVSFSSEAFVLFPFGKKFKCPLLLEGTISIIKWIEKGYGYDYDKWTYITCIFKAILWKLVISAWSREEQYVTYDGPR